VITDTGAVDRVEALIEELVGAARAALTGMVVPEPAREVLDGLIDAATARVA
jgi:hypothetical protein